MTDLTIASALLIGLLGSSHCLAMCGGLASVLGADTQGARSRLLSYNLGRISTYAVLGALVGFLGEQLVNTAPQLGLPLRVLAGLLLVAMGLYVSQWWMGLTQLEKIGEFLWKKVQPLTRSLLPIENQRQAFLLGSLWGLLPCGLVYSALSWSLAAADWQQSMLFMLAFGVGTIPAMLAIGFINGKILQRLRGKNLRALAGVMIIAMGLLTVITPWSHSAATGSGE